jgi:hypothetical protein
MATQGEVRFASLLKGTLEKIKGINMLTSEANEAAYYKELEGLAADVNLMLDEKNPKRAIVTQKLVEQVAYYRVTRVNVPVGKTARSRQATASHVAKQLETLFPILDVDPQVLIREVEVPKNPVGDVKTDVPASEKEKTDEKPSDAPAKGKEGFFTTRNMAIGAGALALVFFGPKLLGGRKSNPRRRK